MIRYTNVLNTSQKLESSSTTLGCDEMPTVENRSLASIAEMGQAKKFAYYVAHFLAKTLVYNFFVQAGGIALCCIYL